MIRTSISSFLNLYRKTKFNRLLIIFLVITVTLLLGLIINGLRSSVIPSKIKNEVDYVIYYPGKNTDWAVDASTFKYDPTSKVISYVAHYGSATITIAEQSTPQNFTDIPEAYAKLTEKLNEYSSFDSLYGKVSLTKPEEFKGDQTAVINSKGTMMFIHVTSGKISDDQWKKLFDNLYIIR
jgi:hypothetical protein